MNSRKRQQIGTTFVVLSVILICFCFSLAPLCFSAPTEGQEQGPTTNSNNLDKASSSAEEFTTYIKNPSTQAYNIERKGNEFSNIVINDNNHDIIGTHRRTYLQQFKDKLVNTHNGRLHLDLKLDEDDDDEDEEDNQDDNSDEEENTTPSLNNPQRHHSLLNQRYHHVELEDGELSDLEQHAHTDEDTGEGLQNDAVSIVHRSLSEGGNNQPNTQGAKTTNNAGTAPSGNNNGVAINSKVKVVFDPPFLDFDERPLCNPIAKTFNIIKEEGEEDQPLQVTAVTTESLIFHPSISKKENNKVTVNLIFLPRTLKRSEGSIVIHTNFGPFIFKAYGGGIENAYNIKPILGHKLPVGADYRKPIFLHNPHQNETLHVNEIYTSEDFLLLSLPDQNSSDKNYSKKNPLLSLWRIEPHQTKAIILLNFHANQPKKHTGFVHVNTNRGQFIIPVEFIVSTSGVHRVADEIDFGTFTSPNEKRARDVVLLNSSPYPVLVSEAYLSKPDPNLKLEFTKNTVLQEGSIVTVAKVVFSSDTQGEFIGKIVFRTNDTSTRDTAGKIEVPYRARIIHGTLDYKMNSTAFYSGDGLEKENEMVLMNGFDVPIRFTSADVFDKRFTLKDFTPGFVLQPKDKKKILSISYHPSDSHLIHKSNLILHTNVTRLYIPLYSYHGNLEHIPIDNERNILDSEKTNEGINMGVLSLSSRKIHYFSIYNQNPVPIKIVDWKVLGMANKKSSISISYVKVYLEGEDLSLLASVKPTKISENINAKHGEGAKDSFIFAILPNQKVIMRIDVYTPTSDEEQNGFIEFVTQYKSLVIPLRFICMEGVLTFPNQFLFDPTFPGKIQKRNIYATNTFGRSITVTDVKSTDERFIPVITHKTIEANQRTNIGYVLLDASKVAKEKNYMQDDGRTNSNTYSKKISSISSDEFTKYRWRNSLFDEIKNSGEINVIGTVTIDTDIAIQYQINVSTTLEYPKLSPQREISFKLTHIGSSVSQYLSVENPSDHHISLQLILGNGSLAKFLQRNTKPVGSMPKIDQAQGDKSYTEFKLHKDGMHSAVIPPHRQANLGPIVFTPKSDSTPSVAFLYIRNNLTIFDIVKLTGTGGSSKVVFSENGSDLSSLKFEIKESQLGTWDNYTNRFVQNNYSSSHGGDESQKNELIFHKKFTLYNKGNMPITILSSSIENMGCSAYGVKIHKCGKFELQPGQNTSYKISYKPDFTTAVVDLYIRLETDQGKLSYPIRFILPYNVLPYFYETQPISTGHRLFRVAATFIVLTLALYIIFRACRELKTLDSNDNELPTSLSDFIKPNFSISSFPFLTFPDMEKQAPTQKDENQVDKNEDSEANKNKKKEKKKKAPKASPALPSSTNVTREVVVQPKTEKPKKPKQNKTPTQSMPEGENTQAVSEVVPALPASEGEKTPVSLSPELSTFKNSPSVPEPSQNVTNVEPSNADVDQTKHTKVKKNEIVKKKEVATSETKKQPFAKKKFNEQEANIVIKPKAFASVPATSVSSGEKPKFYAVKLSNGITETVSTISTSTARSVTPNSNELSQYRRDNPSPSVSTKESSPLEAVKTRERSTSDSATYKPSPQPVSSVGSDMDSESSSVNEDQLTPNSNTMPFMNLIGEGSLSPPTTISSVFNDNDLLSRSQSVSPPPVQGTAPTTREVGVIGNRQDNGMAYNTMSSQPYWYFGSGVPNMANNVFGPPAHGFGANTGFVSNPVFMQPGFTNAPPVVNRLAATFQQRSNAFQSSYFSLFDNNRPNGSLFSGDNNSSFFNRSNASSPSNNSDSTSSTNVELNSSLFSFLPADDLDQQQK